jgi:hypothetical protein
MADAHRGKELFAQRLEYPLPKRAGTKDYVFYFIARGDPYRESGEKFFTRFYKEHVAKDVHSLEEMIDALAAEVDRGVTHIREIVLFAHANALGMLFPVVKGVTNTNLKEYKYLTAFALACLQKDLDAHLFASLGAKRTKVLGKLRDDSWVTVRACNFGRSEEGMYALYAFFGGKANVYCPIQFQYFGTTPITVGMKFENHLEVHEHLVRQHFFPKDVHTLERKDAVVTAIVDKAKFSEPFEIARMRLEDAPPDEVAAYEPLITELNKRTVRTQVRTAFDANGFTLPPKPAVDVISRDTHWTITQKNFRHEDATVTVLYDIYESIEFDDRNRRIAVLRAGASIEDKVSERETVPFQLFFSAAQNDAFRGKVLLLAAYTDEPLQPDDKTRFNAVRAALDHGSLAAGTVDIEAELENETTIDLAPGTKPVKVSSTGSDEAPRITWAVSDNQNRFKVMLEHPLSPDDTPAHTITVYHDYANQEERIMAEYRAVATNGTNPDGPGTELAASFDRLSLDDLFDVLEHLRSPYKPTHAYYIQHVQAALARKKDFRQWMIDHVPVPETLMTDPRTGLSRSEDQDYTALSYSFEFSSVWAEVKSSNPPKTPIRTDLFAEEDLAKTFGIENAVKKENRHKVPLPDLDPDSPATDVEELRALQRVGFEPFLTADKDIVQHGPRVEPRPPTCAEFAVIIEKWKQVKDLPFDEMREALEAVQLSDERTYFDVLKGLKTHVKAWLKILDLSLKPLPGQQKATLLDFVVMGKKDTLKLAFKRVPFLIRLETLGVLLDIEFVFTIPFAMWMDFAEAQVEASRAWYLTGRMTAFRQWLRELGHLARVKGADFPSSIDIDLKQVSPGLGAYYIARYKKERLAESHVFDDSDVVRLNEVDFKEGFDEQANQMPFLGVYIMRETDEVLAELMRQSDLDPCMFEVLRREGVVDLTLARAQIIEQFADEMLNRLRPI